MNWVEQDSDRKVSTADSDRAALLDKVKLESHPIIKNEATNGAPDFKPLDFTPVRSPGIFEGEFGSKNFDLIFHFFPYGYGQAHRDGRAAPRFKPDFKSKLERVMGDTFGSTFTEAYDDKDVGALCVKICGWGQHQYMRELSIKACEALHKSLGGEEG
jgi:hypothetical protein